MSSDLHIVAQVIRVGRMLLSESAKKNSTQCYRRPYGVAVFKLTPEILQESDSEVKNLYYIYRF